MLAMKCWGCGHEGRVQDRYAGLRVTCKWCRAVNIAPLPATQEDFVPDWLPALEPATGPVTAEYDVPAWVREAV